MLYSVCAFFFSVVVVCVERERSALVVGGRSRFGVREIDEMLKTMIQKIEKLLKKYNDSHNYFQIAIIIIIIIFHCIFFTFMMQNKKT